MALQFSDIVRDAWAAQLEAAAGPAALFQLRTGPPPATPASPPIGTLLLSIVLPANWLTDPAAGSVDMVGAWSSAGLAVGNAGHFQIRDATGAVCHMQGTVTVYGGGGDVEIDGIAIVVDQVVMCILFSLTAPHA